MSLDRRDFLTTGALALGSLAGCITFSSSSDQGTGSYGSTDQSDPTQSPTATGSGRSSTTTDSDRPSLDTLELRVDRLAGGFKSLVDVAVPRPRERFVVDQFGTISRIDGDGSVTVALDLSEQTVDISGFDERGLLGIAFHPDYDGSGRVFLRYSSPPRSGTPSGYSHTFVLSEFSITDGTIDRESEQTILEIPQPQPNHNAGAIGFGPDGYLYVAVGDGGAGGDQAPGHVDDWYDAVDGGNGQDVTENLLGSILRLDVDDTPADEPYGIPDDNPLVGTAGLDEQYAWGFRNPWRFSFGPDGRFFVADVGQSRYEEVNVVESGGNYGWNVREGAHCFQASDCPTETPGGDPLIDPIIEYPHGGEPVSGVSVIGGYLYDGDAIPALQDRYVFADWRAQGKLFVAQESEKGQWPVTPVPVTDGPFGSNVLSFGQQPDGELLVCTTGNDGGSVLQLRSA